ncbi:hypothetical protein Hte_004474 [Hypoxylon texense]
MAPTRQKAMKILERFQDMVYEDLTHRYPVSKDIEIYDEVLAFGCSLVATLIPEDSLMPLQYSWPFFLYAFQMLLKYLPHMIDEFATWQKEAHDDINCAIFDIFGNHHDDMIERNPGVWTCTMFLAWIEKSVLGTSPPQPRLLPGSPTPASLPSTIRWYPELPQHVPQPSGGPAYKTMFFRPPPGLSYEKKTFLIPDPYNDEERKVLIDQAIFAWRDMHRRGLEGGDVASPSTPEETPSHPTPAPADVQPRQRLNISQYHTLFIQESVQSLHRILDELRAGTHAK